MTSRRINSGEKTLLEKDDTHDFSPAAGEKSNTTPAVPANVIFKLLGFTIAMFAGPILTYFLIFKITSSSTLAGATAAVMANVVLISYVIVAWKDDQSEAIEAAEKEKKSK